MEQDLFQKELLEALQHLYSPAWLQNSPLLEVFPTEDRNSPVVGFQRLISEAIQAIRPDTNVPPQSDAWRAYHVLVYRFIEGSSQRVVAANMSLSERQLRREEHRAAQLLGRYLWERYNLRKEQADESRIEGKPASADRTGEMNWLRQSQPYETAAIGELVDSALRTASGLVIATGLRIEQEIPAGLPPVTGQIGVLRQALVNLLSAAVSPLGWQQMSIAAWEAGEGITVRFEGMGGQPDPQPDDYDETLEMVDDLVRLFGGTLKIEVQPGNPVVEMCLPLHSGIPVLLVDDNADAHQLIQRYLTGSPYHLIGTRSPQEVIELAEEYKPSLVLLDIMLPGRDGWEILAQLRENPATSLIPVVVCTILPQEQLALALGAAAFLRKPVMQAALLKTLDSLLGRFLPESG
jgi:CheY-like chemotaxis protein